MSERTEHVLITGATSGIGYALAHSFARRGWRVTVVGRDTAAMWRACKDVTDAHSVGTGWVVCDLSDSSYMRGLATQSSFTYVEDIIRIHDGTAPFTALVNCAGFSVFGDFEETELATELEMVQVNCAATVRLTKLVVRDMLQRGYGRVLNVASLGGFVPTPLTAVYGASKAFVLSFSRALAEELRGSGVTVTALCPGGVATQFQKRAGCKPDNNCMSAHDVAEAGYRACMAGEDVCVPGCENALKAVLFRLLPRLGAKVVHHYHKRNRL